MLDFQFVLDFELYVTEFQMELSGGQGLRAGDEGSFLFCCFSLTFFAGIPLQLFFSDVPTVSPSC
jgi:hypothetical protein